MASSSSIVLFAPDSPLVRTDYLAVSMIVLDRSGSMKKFGRAPIRGMRQFTDALAADPNAGVTAVSIMTFADRPTLDVPPTLVPSRPHLAGYEPRGGTLLYSTLCVAMGLLQRLEDERARLRGRTDVILTVFTDGDDNLSREALPKLQELSAEGRRRGWQMHVFGFGINGLAIAEQIGFVDPADPAGSSRCGGEYVEASQEAFARSVTYTVTCTSSASAASMRRPPSST